MRPICLEDFMDRRIIVHGFHPKYTTKLLNEAAEHFGSLRKVAFALGIGTAVIYRWRNNETEMGEKWVISLENLLKKSQSLQS
jgi:hypothetical protein